MNMGAIATKSIISSAREHCPNPRKSPRIAMTEPSEEVASIEDRGGPYWRTADRQQSFCYATVGRNRSLGAAVDLVVEAQYLWSRQ
jgi:hypothetical protein